MGLEGFARPSSETVTIKNIWLVGLTAEGLCSELLALFYTSDSSLIMKPEVFARQVKHVCF